MNHIGSWFLIEHGEVTIWVNDRDAARLLSTITNFPTTPRAQVVHLINYLISRGMSRSEAIDHVLTTSDYAGLIRRAKTRQSGNPSATRRTIYNWLREHNQ